MKAASMPRKSSRAVDHHERGRPRPGGGGNASAYDRLYDPRTPALPLNPFQRACADTLQHGLLALNSALPFVRLR